jgi:hypothetical protein
MFVCLIGLAAGIFFLSVGYGMLLAVLFGLATSLHMTAGLETAKIEARTAAGQATLAATSQPPLNGPRAPEPRVRPRENLLNGRRVRFGRFMGRGAASPPSRPD